MSYHPAAKITTIGISSTISHKYFVIIYAVKNTITNTKARLKK